MFFDFLTRPKCFICGRNSETGLCKGCINQFQFLRPPFCKVCKSNKIIDNCCLECQSRVPLFENVITVGIYNGILKSLIYELKYQGLKKYAKPLGFLLAQKIKNEISFKEIDFITSIPLHPEKLKIRKYNQAKIISLQVAKSLNKPYLDLISRHKNTKAQFLLSHQQRIENISDAFEINTKKNLTGKNILIVDDIFTTGTTVQEACKVLKEALAGEIYVGVIARSLT